MKKQPTKAQLGRMIKILKEAKQCLWDGTKRNPNWRVTTTYICFAIERITRPEANWGEPAYIDEYKLRNAVKDAISRGINRRTTFDSYMVSTKRMPLMWSHRDMQKARHDWLDQIISDWTKIWEGME